MSWVAVGLGGGALLGVMKSAQEQKNQKAQMMANAAQIQYSPWTGMKSNVQGPTTGGVLNGAVGGALQGGLTGALIGQQLKTPTAATGGAATSAMTPSAGNLEANTALSPALGQPVDYNQAMNRFGVQSDYAALNKPNFYRGPAGQF